MEWTRAVDGYCERMGPEYWAEPLNAVTNLAFIVAAIVMWHRGQGSAMVRFLSAVIFAIGIGSYLFHTHAEVWAGVADVAPISMFVFIYLYAFNRDIVGLAGWVAGIGTIVLVVGSSVLTTQTGWLMQLMGSSGGYASVLLLLLGYAALMVTRDRAAARNLALAAALFAVSLTFRTLDEILCSDWPMGTHFVWHLLNGLLLAWLIELYLRARLGKGGTAG